MRTLCSLLVFVVGMAVGVTQPGPTNAPQTEPPNSSCRFGNRFENLRSIKDPPPEVDLSFFDMPSVSNKRVHFQVGAIVNVNRQERTWSCVTGPVEAMSGSAGLRTGWIPTSFLEPLKRK